ncbi:hypothetical protein H4J38_14300 [Colwellia sp. BRX10-3]|uniref:hypothetical protein n=1 Tax=Colwellia sp. BRX10-3 TaxID=2759844 RepID=UPI0015F3CD54|nr:hypothetical protein [Colwellia sp. BRX10-3]MBA6391943.1 hypothetical protein [Colwellia sp. BRX10-3]
MAFGFLFLKLNHTRPSVEVVIKLVSQIPMGKLGLPGEVVGLMELLVFDIGSYITGKCIEIDDVLTR